jgi:Xaa-Pro aminopeptidase
MTSIRHPGDCGKIILFFAAFLLFLPSFLPAQKDAKHLEGIGQEEYRNRRERVAAMLDSSSALVMKAFDVRTRSHDVSYRYRQESHFLYLTGFNEPNCYLLIAPRGVAVDGSSSTILLFVPAGSEQLSQEAQAPGEVVLANDRVKDLFEAALKGLTTLYVSAPDLGFRLDWLNGKPLFIERDSRKQFEEAHPGIKVRPAGSLVAAGRSIKSAAEVDLIQRAIDMTGAGLQRAWKICKPGTWEYELQAEVEYEMTRNGADYEGFPSIIGSGENSLILHYDLNKRKTKSGDLVVMDVGAEYQGYSADITRTIPVSGRFTKAQKEVYEVVLRAQKEVIQMIRPGVSMGDLDKRTRAIITEAGYGDFIRHGVSHPLGIDVHDVGTGGPLKPGMVITVEPGIYIPPDAETVKPEYRGFGIRIEDDVLVTETGYKLLSKNIPKEVREIESIMKR